MEKETFQRTLQAFKNAGIDKYMVCIGGDNNRMFNNESSIVVDKGDCVVIFNLCDNVGNLTIDAVYDVAVLDYGNISNLKAIGMTMEQGLAIAAELGIDGEDSFKDLIKNNKPRQNNNPGVGGQLKVYTKEVDTDEPELDNEGNPVLDEEGNPVMKKQTVPTLPGRMSHYVYTG